jgi:hypothetical protein
MTTHLPTHHSFFASSWLPKRRQSHPIPPIRLATPHTTFFLLTKIKFQLKGHHFDTSEDIRAELQEVLDTVNIQ